MQGRIRKWLEIAALKATLALVLTLSALALSGCTTTRIIRGNFCDLYEYDQPSESRREFGNDAVYQCLCLDSDSELCE